MKESEGGDITVGGITLFSPFEAFPIKGHSKKPVEKIQCGRYLCIAIMNGLAQYRGYTCALVDIGLMFQ